MANFLDALSRAKSQLTEAKSLPDVKDIRDKAMALERYFRASKDGLESQNLAAELRLRAERRAGDLLKGMEKSAGGRPSKKTGSTKLPVLDDLGITKTQSSRWQHLSTVPEGNFEAYIASCVAHKREISTKDVAKMAARRPVKRQVSQEVGVSQEIVSSLDALEGRKFGTILADPPWRYGNQATRAATNNHYDTMSVDELCQLPIAEMAADDGHLHLWTTNAFLPEAFNVIDAWGFEYRSCFVWVKPQMGIGNYWRVSHEFLLLGIRGNAKSFSNHSLKSWGQFDRGKHSAKPEEVRGLIEQASPGPYLELFGRSAVNGWTVFGNQIHPQMRFA